MSSSGINPTVAMWLNVVFLVLTGIGAGSWYLGVSPEVTTMIKGYSTDAVLCIVAINIVFHAFAAPVAGAGVKFLKRM